MESYDIDGRVYPADLINDLKLVRQFDNSGPKADVFLDTSPARHDPCPNCGGEKGKGRLYAPTGDKCKPYHMGGTTVSRGVEHPLRRALVGYNCPVCSDGSYRRTLRQNSGVPLDILAERLLQHPGRREMEEAINRVLHRWTTVGPEGWLSLVGPFGSGKTFLAQRLVAQLNACDVEATYTLAHTLGQRIMDSISNDESPAEILARYYRVPVLALDQLDWLRTVTSGGQMTYVVEHLLNLLDDRYQKWGKLGTVLIVNRDWWTRKEHGQLEAVHSRMEEGVVAETSIASLRATAGEERRLEWWHD